MKIAFYTDQFPKLSETFILNQITGLIEFGHDVSIYALTDPSEDKVHPDVEEFKLYDKFLCINMPKNRFFRVLKAVYLLFFYLIPTRFRIIRTLNFLKYREEALSLKLFYAFLLFRKNPPPFIHTHFGPNGLDLAFLRDFKINIEFTTVFHGFDMSVYPRRNGKDIYISLFQKGTHFLPISEYWGKKLQNMGCPEDRITVHHMGINPEEFTPDNSASKSDSGKFKILSIGRLVEKKGHEYVIRAIAAASESIRTLHLTIIGCGPREEYLRNLTDELGIRNIVSFEGARNKKEIIEHYRNSDVFVLPSITPVSGEKEGIPVVIMEAMSMSLPVISTWHSGIPEIIKDKENGFLIPEKNVELLKEKIIYLNNHPEFRINMGKHGRDFVEKHFNITKLNKKLETLIRQFIDRLE
jgi:colanic acid/amylovoran/stewartan biosynthesis glycosyltransferase WcaL/AmsK/CpsK